MPVIHETAYVDVSAQVIGDVAIGQDSSIWMNAVVRGDVHSIRIGRRTNIQDGTIVHVMLLAQEPNLREVIAFPMTQSAEDLLMNAPSPVSEKQLRELHIRIVEPRK